MALSELCNTTREGTRPLASFEGIVAIFQRKVWIDRRPLKTEYAGPAGRGWRYANMKNGIFFLGQQSKRGVTDFRIQQKKTRKGGRNCRRRRRGSVAPHGWQWQWHFTLGQARTGTQRRPPRMTRGFVHAETMSESATVSAPRQTVSAGGRTRRALV